MSLFRTLIVGAGLGLLLFGGCAGYIVDFPEKQQLTEEEIVADLTGDDFRRKNSAREQLGKLAKEKRIDIMKRLLESEDTATRLLAVSELAKVNLVFAHEAQVHRATGCGRQVGYGSPPGCELLGPLTCVPSGRLAAGPRPARPAGREARSTDPRLDRRSRHRSQRRDRHRSIAFGTANTGRRRNDARPLPETGYRT